MSYILDALKKIEHEKITKSNANGRVSISGDLFKERTTPDTRLRVWKIASLILVASLVTSAGTWIVMGGNSKKNAIVATPSTEPSSPPLAQPDASRATSIPVKSHSAPAASAPSSGTPETSKTVEKRSNNETKDKFIHLTQVPLAVPAPDDIKLSGIAWQDDRSARRAVINGYLLKEGAVVSGARITDIQADRVYFASAAGRFEVKLDAVLPAGGQQ